MALGRIGALGPLVAWSTESAAIELGPLRQQAVLAAMALRANRPISTSELLSWVWGEQVPSSGEQVVHTYVYRLRRLIEPDAEHGRYRLLVRESNGYTLRLASDQFDVTQFENTVSRADVTEDPAVASDLLAEGLRLWRGEPLAGLPGPFLAAQRLWLAEHRLSVHLQKTDIDLRLGRAAEVLPDLVSLVDEHPLNEKIAGLLMTALARAGRQNEALAVFLKLRKRMVNELGVEPGRELQQLHSALLRGADARPVPAQARVLLADPVGRPVQLPRDVTNFTGRAEVLRNIVALLDGHARDQVVPVVAISGRPGVGKTTLAVHAAHRIRARFPDGQLYLSLRGTCTQPMAPADALDYLLRSLGVDGRNIPGSTEERSALFRSRLAERRVLVLLDNARDEQQVRPLLPGTVGSAVLVTGLRPLVALDGITTVQLDSFKVDDSVTLLRSIVGAKRVDAERDAAVRIAEFCAQLPLALHIAAGKLVARPHWSLRRLAEMLADERSRLDDLAIADRAVRSSIALSEQLLDDEHVRAFHLLSRLDLPVLDLTAAAALLDVDRRTAQRTVEVLVDHQLLDVVGADAVGDLRVRFHDLIRLYSRDRATETISDTEWAAALGRVLSAYLSLAEIADEALPVTTAVLSRGTAPRVAKPDRVVAEWIRRDPTSWFSAEELSLTLLIEHACQTGFESSAWELAEALTTYAVLKSRWDVWRRTSEMALAAARRVGDRHGEACMVASLAKIGVDRVTVTAARSELDRALDLFAALGDRRAQGRVLKEIAQCSMHAGDVETAIDEIRAAMVISESVDDIQVTADDLLALGQMFVLAGRYPGAMDALSQAAAVCRKLAKPRGEAMAMWQLAAALTALGRPADAAENLRAALAMLEPIGDLRGQACILRDLGDLSELDERAHDPARYLRRCLEICEQIGELRFRAQAEYRYGKLELRRGSRAEATVWLRRSLDTWTRLGDGAGIAEVTNLLEAMS
jgi:DNA-binding SARP family transcriptional activator/tetratricopeptide (TPR) repeat protein